MDMNEIIVKSEEGEEILLYYIDENGIEQSMVTSVTVDTSSGHHQVVQQIVPEMQVQTEQPNQIEILEFNEDQYNIEQQLQPRTPVKDRWTEDETNALLTFYIDNKDAFLNGITKKKFLWNACCSTILKNKNAATCEMKLHNIKRKFIQVHAESGGNTNWPFYNLCNQAFFDDELEFNSNPNSYTQDESSAPVKVHKTINENGIVIIKKVDSTKSYADEKVVALLQLYLEHKNSMKHLPKELWQKGLWESIATRLGTESPDYWHRRFMNFKQNYIRLLDRRQESGAQSITWPYLSYFDEIYKDDVEFKKKYSNIPSYSTGVRGKPIVIGEPEWYMTEMTVLAKYVFDCFSEFCDPTIPDKFLWSEVGRLLDRNPELCEKKYQQLKEQHLKDCSDGSYVLKTRTPLDIIFDNIISKEVALELENANEPAEEWKTHEIDVIVQFVYKNIEMLKDPICFNVCWACLAIKMERSIPSCKGQWDILVALYESILKDKKENSEMEIDWRYIEIFDKIFDYGTDHTLLNGFQTVKRESDEVIKKETTHVISNSRYNEDNLEEETGGRGNVKAFKILEFYQKHKDLFKSTNRSKPSCWQPVAKQLNLTANQCAHRFRNLKQVYMSYLNRECKQPDKLITWPYYSLCKKVFGYRSLKAKIQKKTDADYNYKEWTNDSIKKLIHYLGQNFDEITKNLNSLDSWTKLADLLNKDEEMCKNKFLELRKSYRKLKTMLTRNPHTKISWKYFSDFDAIYTEGQVGNSNLLENYEMMDLDEDIKKEIQDDDDIQCIIVVPEGQTIEDVLMQGNQQNTPADTTKWTLRTKKQLLRRYLNYIKSHRGETIISNDMWKEIAEEFPYKTPVMCRRMFLKLKQRRIAKVTSGEVAKKLSYDSILDRILSMKPKFMKKKTNGENVVNDVALRQEIVEQVLEYYLENLQEFLSPKFEKKRVWLELATKVNEPMMKVYNKVRFLKQAYSADSSNTEIEGYDILKRIFEKQKAVKEKIIAEKNAEVSDFSANDNEWTEEQTEQLLIWYLLNLDKFKNPKYINRYLWKDASNIVEKSPLGCSNKMSEIRTEYKSKVNNSPNELKSWRFADLCQKIYGTGKKI